MTDRARAGVGGNRVTAVLLIVWMLAILGATLRPVVLPSSPEQFGFWCLACGDRGMADAFLNFVAFIPGGLLAGRILGGRWAVVAAVLGSVGLELLQSAIPGRYPSLSDIVFNGGGALVGVLLARPGVFRLARVAGAALAVLAWLAPALLMIPVPAGPAVFGQWEPAIGGMGRYGGAVLGARVGGLPVPSWRIEDPQISRALDDPMDLELTVRTGPTPDGIAPVFAVAVPAGFRLLVLAASGNDLAFHRRGWAARIRLEQPLAWFPDALEGRPEGSVVLLSVQRGPDGTCVAVDARQACRLDPGLEHGWQFLFGSVAPPGLAASVSSMLWCVGLGVLLGLGAGGLRAARLLSVVLIGAGAVVAGASPYLSVHPSWGAFLALGALVGPGLGPRTSRWMLPGGTES